MVTDAAYRRRGFSRACMTAVLDWFAERGVSTVDLRATADGEPLYRELGFAPVSHTALRWAAGRR
ncbi:GNAT family N-acetyltransferase [Catellatospora paridis]|uniref:GNAT family N-acetyltransferase n=1 Tax=Catellatospora paridis TaxID=1617086 RepID=UPI001E5E2349|nr:GNAT family N-acetyltransferase [Catellatospora paridis]